MPYMCMILFILANVLLSFNLVCQTTSLSLSISFFLLSSYPNSFSMYQSFSFLISLSNSLFFSILLLLFTFLSVPLPLSRSLSLSHSLWLLCEYVNADIHSTHPQFHDSSTVNLNKGPVFTRIDHLRKTNVCFTAIKRAQLNQIFKSVGCFGCPM